MTMALFIGAHPPTHQLIGAIEFQPFQILRQLKTFIFTPNELQRKEYAPEGYINQRSCI